MSPQALRFAQGRILGETNSSWYVGDITPENEIRVMECISKLDTHEIKSPYRERPSYNSCTVHLLHPAH
jgi:hypothetical protein